MVSLIDNAKASGTPYILLVLGGFVLAGFMSIIAALVGTIVNNEEKRDRRTVNVVRYAYKTINLSLTKFTHFVPMRVKRTAEQNIGSVLDFQTEVVREIYGLLEHEYGEGEFLEERIDFEVTFITKSYKDHELTIASWANKDGRAPKSLAARELNPLLYRQYRGGQADINDPNYSVRIIARTSAKEYKGNLYPGQKTRIKSSIIYPVFRDDF